MKILAWNYRGLGNATIVRTLKGLICKVSPNLVFLMETKKDSLFIKCLRIKLHFDHCCSMDAQRRKGGLAVLWKGDRIKSISAFSNNLIKVGCQNNAGIKWCFWCCYVTLIPTLKLTFWEFLSMAIRNKGDIWVCIGDFNKIVSQKEKVRGRMFISTTRSLLKGFIYDVGIIDLGFHGNLFTWSNRRSRIS